ncbi:MAG TPA: GNAT family N-acetyltransferase [Steroidobacteraceae bacterium]|nr:GNAT family N-acetyltransferase [Steroidobacteraceae bacterium]
MTFRPARILESIAQIDARSWNALAGTAQPFLRHEFFLALEQSGCAAARTGWTPRHLIVEDAKGVPAAAMPLFRKAHSRGEFVFDFSWAGAYAQHGLNYYPKLLTAVPFTPVSGPRVLVGPDVDAKAITKSVVRAALDYARSEQLSSWHVLFPTDETAADLDRAGLILRRDCQFHWYNHGYESFESFLATFTAEKRKKAKRERRRVAEAGIEFDTLHGGDMTASLWDVVYEFYADTFHRHGHEPYLNLDFFKRVSAAMPDELMLKVARVGAEPIAVAIFFVGSEALYGRYWGAGGNFHSLHFEACYYQGIEYCIEKKLQRFEPGTQGEHKVPRGFVPTLTHSAHYIADRRFAAAIRDYAQREARGVDNYAAAVNEHVPYHRTPDEELRL